MIDLASRTASAQALLADDAVPLAISAELYAAHPQWEARYGPAGRARCTEDVRYHVTFLAGAVQAGCTALFADYARWCAEMLAARGIPKRHLIEVFDLLENRLVGPDGSKPFHQMFEAARDAVQREATTTRDPPQETPLHGAYLAAALAGRRAEAWQLMVAARDGGLSTVALYQMLLAAQRRLGELWVSTTISVAQEHMASAVTQSIVARLYSEIRGPRERGSVLLAGVEGELHALPAQFAADQLELDGWDVMFIGTNTPERGILDAVARHSPAVLALSTTMAFNLPRTVALAKAARARFPTLPIVLGGRAIRGAGSLADELDVQVDDAPRRHVLSPRSPWPSDLAGSV